MQTELAPSPVRVASRNITGTAGEISEKYRAPFRRALLAWYDQHRRDLPWRKTLDPYAIWLSEIMLQQTRVAAVLDHYRIFLERFPNVESLAAATEDDVLAVWSGLGYYRRARMMHRCAKEIVQSHGSKFPRTSDALLELPGIGRYTAAAIASIVFSEPVAVVDGNVERVLQRLAGTDLTNSQIWQQAQALLATQRPGDFNQSMMELGATVCVPGEPRCPICPVRKWCALAQSRAMERRKSVSGPDRTRNAIEPTLPLRQLKQVKKEISYLLNQRDDHIHLVQRSRKASLMPGMWELPQAPDARPLLSAIHWRTFRHSITVTDYTVHVLRDVPSPENPGPPKGKWIAIDRIPQIPITGLTRKILKADGIL